MKIGDRIYEKYFDDFYPYEIVNIIDCEHIQVRSCIKKRTNNSIIYVVEEYKPEILDEHMLNDLTFRKNLYFNYPDILDKINKREIKIGDVFNDNNIDLELSKDGWRQRYKNHKLGNEIFYFLP